MQTFGQLFIKYDLAILKNGMVQIHIKFLIGPSENSPTYGTQKIKNDFFVQKNEKFLWPNFWALQYMYTFAK